MARFLVSHCLRGTRERNAKSSRASFTSFAREAASYAEVVHHSEPRGSRRGLLVLSGDARDLAAKQSEASPDVLIEPELPRQPALFLPQRSLPVPTAQAAEPAAGIGAVLNLVIAGGGKPVEGADVSVLIANLQSGKTIPVSARTDANGGASVTYNPTYWYPAVAMVTPRSAYWSQYVSYPQSGATIALTPLGLTGPLGWWHQLLGIAGPSGELGKGIRIGMADTGVGPHPYLTHAKSLGAFLNGAHDASAGAVADVAVHGTHVAGILGGRPEPSSNGFAGIAPGAELYCARVYRKSDVPGQEPEANNGDIAAAIDALAEANVDLINLSLGGSRRSDIEDDAIQAAIDRGVLILASAGNANGAPVLYPAASPGVVAVTAVGLTGGVAPASIDSLAIPQQPELIRGNLYAAAFNNTGPQIACTGPGVGIISTVPGGSNSFAAMSGTSMACPAVCAALATLLAADPAYQKLPRDRSRAIYAWSVLVRSLRQLGFGQSTTGYGLATAFA